MVVDQDDADTALPVVRIFAALGPGGMVALRPTTLALGQCYGEDAIVGIADPPGLNGQPFADLRAEIMAGAVRASAR